MAIINRLPMEGGGISTLTNIGWNGTYYSNSTGSAGSSSIFYYNSVSSQYMTVSGQNTGTVVVDCKLLVVINAVHSTLGTLNANDWLNIKVNGAKVLETPHGTQRVATNAILLDLKQGDIITGVVHHTSTGYQVNFIYNWYMAS